MRFVRTAAPALAAVLLAGCHTVRMTPPPDVSANTPCDLALGPGKATIEIHGVEHTNICVPIYLTDTGNAAIADVKPSVRVNVFNQADYYLIGVSDFKPVPQQPGHYAGRAPVNSTDEQLGFSVIVQADAFLASRSNLVKFSRSHPVAPEIGFKLVRDLSHQGAKWRPAFDLQKIPPEVFSWIKRSEPIQFLPLRGKKTDPVADLAERFTMQPLDDDPEFVLAKAALLNIYFELDKENHIPDGGSGHWLQQMKKLLAIGRERILVAVDDGMLDAVKSRINGPDPHDCSTYHRASAELHGRNFSLVVHPKAVDEVISAKIPECKGNLQLTVGKFEVEGKGSLTVADIDFDDNFSFAAHASDVTDHWVSGTGTNPILIFEYLRSRYPAAELGYTVRRVVQ